MIRYLALAQKVLAVAKSNDDIGDWAAYIDAVPGDDHETEYMNVARHGDKLPENVAKLLFPGFTEKYKWRR